MSTSIKRYEDEVKRLEQLVAARAARLEDAKRKLAAAKERRKEKEQQR